MHACRERCLAGTDRNGFAAAVRGGTDELVRERFMTRDDADKLMKVAETGDVLKKLITR